MSARLVTLAVRIKRTALRSAPGQKDDMHLFASKLQLNDKFRGKAAASERLAGQRRLFAIRTSEGRPRGHRNFRAIRADACASWGITEVRIYARRLGACLAAMVGCECCWLSR